MMSPPYPFWISVPSKPPAPEPARFLLTGTGPVTATGRVERGLHEVETEDGRRLLLAPGDEALTPLNDMAREHPLVTGRAS